MVLLFEHRGQFDGAVRWRKGRSPGRDRDLATSDDAIPGAYERVMSQRVKLIVRSSCGVTERSASSAARHTSNQEPNSNKRERERVVAFLSVKNQASNAPKVCESKKQVSRSRSRKHQCMNTKNGTSVESDQNVNTQA